MTLARDASRQVSSALAGSRKKHIQLLVAQQR